MTKDRRLGKGLAALLGTPADGEEGFEGGGSSATATREVAEPQSARTESIRDESTRSEVVRSEGSRGEGTRGESIRQMHSAAKSAAPADQAVAVATTPIRSIELKVDEIEPNPFQPRRQFNEEEIASLAESIRTHQQIQPVLVRIVEGRYQLISGERRWRATIHAGLKTIRAEVREADDRLVSELAIIENMQRKDLNAIEKALSFRRYIDQHQCTQDELAKRLSLDRSTIANAMRLLELPPPIIDMVQRGDLTGGHAKPLLALGSEKSQLDLARQVILEGWSVRAVERRVSEIVHSEDSEDPGLMTAIAKTRKVRKDDQMLSLEQQMKMGLGTKIEIQRTSRGRGRIVVHFTSLEEFDRLHGLFAGKFAESEAA